MAPEIINKEKTGLPTDIWALAVLLYVMFTGKYPFAAEHDRDLYRRILNLDFDIPKGIPKAAEVMLRKMF
jgi:serine/threonine protein kinase